MRHALGVDSEARQRVNKRTGMAEWRELIERNPDVLAGTPVVRGTRVPVELVLVLIADGCSEADLLANYPTLSAEGIRACKAWRDRGRAT